MQTDSKINRIFIRIYILTRDELCKIAGILSPLDKITNNET